MVGVTLMNQKCEKCGGYNHELFANNILICEKCRNRMENPMLKRCPKCQVPMKPHLEDKIKYICINCGFVEEL